MDVIACVMPWERISDSLCLYAPPLQTAGLPGLRAGVAVVDRSRCWRAKRILAACAPRRTSGDCAIVLLSPCAEPRRQG